MQKSYLHLRSCSVILQSVIFGFHVAFKFLSKKFSMCYRNNSNYTKKHFQINSIACNRI